MFNLTWVFIQKLRTIMCRFALVPLLLAGGGTAHATESGQTSGENDPYLVCEQGQRQSPINIVTSEHEGKHHDLVFRYQPTSVHIVHDGHSFQALSESTRIVIIRMDIPISFSRAHFHDPSEHHIDGVSYAMELHLVHKDSEGKLLVVGILAQEGEETERTSSGWEHGSKNR